MIGVNSTACTVAQVITNTTGFSLANVQVPFTIPGGRSHYLNLTLTLPSKAFDGALSLIYT